MRQVQTADIASFAPREIADIRSKREILSIFNRGIDAPVKSTFGSDICPAR